MSEKDFDEQEKFNKAKEDYISARKGQKEEIRKKFNDMKESGDNSSGFVVKEVKDRSCPDKNWFGIDVTIEQKYHIALQAYDKDKDSENIHVLMDRLGIYKYDRCNNSDLSFDKIEDKMINANIDLPMSPQPMDPHKFNLLFKEISNYGEIKSCEDDNQDFEDDDQGFNNKKRKEYIIARREQQKLIKDYLGKHNDGEFQFEVITLGAGGHHYHNYHSIKEFNNSIWKYLDVVVIDDNDPQKIKAAFCISLQSFDKDSDVYVVFDKIGIYQYPQNMIENYNNATDKKKDQLKTNNAINKTIKTDISLPMDNEKLEKLKKILEEML